MTPGEHTQNSHTHTRKEKEKHTNKQQSEKAVSLFLYLTNDQISIMISYIPEGAQQMMGGIHPGPPFPPADRQAQLGICSCADFWYQGRSSCSPSLDPGVRPIPLPSFAQWGLLQTEGLRWNQRESSSFTDTVLVLFLCVEGYVYTHRHPPKRACVSLPPTLNNLEQHLPSCAWIIWITSSKAALLSYNPLMIFPVTDSYCHISA